MPPAPLTRREALHGVGAVSVASLTGCLGDPVVRSTADRPAASENPSPQRSASETPDPCQGISPAVPIEEKQERGAAPPISVERTVVRDYHENTFEEWAETECAHVAGDVVLERLDTRLDDGTDGIGYAVSTVGERMVVTIDLGVVLTRCGRIAHRPEASFEQVVDVTPSTVDVTMHVARPGEDREFSCSHELSVHQYSIRQQ